MTFDWSIDYTGSMLAASASGSLRARRLQRQAMRAGRRLGGRTGGGATGRVRSLRRTRSAQVHTLYTLTQKLTCETFALQIYKLSTMYVHFGRTANENILTRILQVLAHMFMG